jgi:hypothetical protein
MSSSYRESSFEGTLDYKQGDRTLFNSALGYTRRENPVSLGGTVSGTTGLLGYTRKLTGKTTIFVGVERAVNSYVVAAATEVDFTAKVKIDWQATGKIAVSATYAYTRSSFTGQLVPLTAIERADDYQASSLNIEYAMLRWLSLRPYASYQTRASNFNFYQYNGAVIGIQLRIQRYP